MLLFHGTRGHRDLVDAIARDGLRAHRHEWAHRTLDLDASTFLANAPVAGAGGDPMAFAMGYGAWNGPRTPGDGWIVVVDLPRDAFGAVRAVVPNHELTQYFAARTLRTFLTSPLLVLDDAGTGTRRTGPRPLLVEALAELGRRDDLPRLAASLRPVLASKRDDLRADDLTFARWRRYAGDLRAARTLDEVARAGRRWGFAWGEPEVPHCALCVEGMATWLYAVDAPLACADGNRVGLWTSLAGQDLLGDGLAAFARIVARAYAGASPAAVADGFAKLRAERGNVTWGDVLARTPIDAAALPPSWSPDFGRAWTERDARATDAQLVCDAIGPEHVVGALRVAAGNRLRPWARPRRGETLAAKLWHAATVVRDRHRGRCVVYDG
jgi:hypothetical protein